MYTNRRQTWDKALHWAAIGFFLTGMKPGIGPIRRQQRIEARGHPITT